MASDSILVIPALGRRFTLGMLYDARTDEVIPGVTFWDDKTLNRTVVTNDHQTSDFHITTADSMEARFSLLDVDTSFKATLISGHTELGGSARFLKDKKNFHNQCRVTFQYKATSSFKQLPLTVPEAKKMEQVDSAVKGLATHIVTGILYGGNGFFVFDSEKLETSNIQNIQDQMEAIIRKIPTCEDQGKVNIQLTDKEKALADTLSCKIYADSISESNPTTFNTAVKTYVQLVRSRFNVVPLKVHLMPLKRLDSSAAEVKRGISIGLVRKAEEALEELQQVEMRCNDCLEDKTVKTFPHLQKNLSSFRTLCNYYRAELQMKMATEVPLIRAGAEDESFLKETFGDRHKSPFSHEKLSRWIEVKEREINVLRSCVEMMKGIKIIPNQSELDREVLAPGADNILCFVFTSLQSRDPYVQEMANYLDSFDEESAASSPSDDQWYFSDEVVLKMREKAKAFRDLEKALKNNSRFRFFVATIANENHTGASVSHYRDASLVSDDLSVPDVANVEKVTNRWSLIWYACDLTLDPDSANGCVILSDGNKKATNGAEQLCLELPERFDHFPQVLCREGLTGRRYWEVEWSAGKSEDVAVGVCYTELHRKGDGDECKLGRNVTSWCLGHKWLSEEPALCAEHDKQSVNIPLPSVGCSRLGVYLDWPAGTLSYYKVSGDSLTHLHTFRTKFTEPVYPAFRIGRENNHVFLSL